MLVKLIHKNHKKRTIKASKTITINSADKHISLTAYEGKLLALLHAPVKKKKGLYQAKQENQ